MKDVELLKTRQKRAVVSIVGKPVSVMFGTVSEKDIKKNQEKTENVEEDQKVLAHVARESISSLNITRLELTKNRGTINWLVNNMETLREEVGNVTGGLMELDSFCLAVYSVGKVHQTSQSLITLLEHVRE